MANEIDLDALKAATNAILDHIVTDLGMRKVAVKDTKDFYWEVPSDRLYAVKEAQPQLDVGRLSDDLEFLQDLPTDKRQAVAAMLIHIAPLLRFIGEEVGK